MSGSLTPSGPDCSVSAVTGRDAGGGQPDCVELLEAAFRRSKEAIRWWWSVRVSRLPAPGRGGTRPAGAAVRIDLTAEDAAMLARLLNGAALAPGLGLPWLSTAEVAHQISVTQSTIRSWLASGRPQGHPFPDPDERRNGRSYWLKATIDAWKAEHDNTDALRGRRRRS